MIEYKLLKNKKPSYYFIPFNHDLEEEYRKGFGVQEIFEHYNSGIQTKNDAFTIKKSKQDLEEIINDFQSKSLSYIKNKYQVLENVWTLSNALKSLDSHNFDKNNLLKIAYRPFDNRWTYLNSKSSGFIGTPGYNQMKHMLNRDNVGLVFERGHGILDWQHIFITDKVIDCHLTGSKSSLAPLYLYTENNGNNNKIKTNNDEKCDVFYSELKGSREYKLNTLKNYDF